MSNLEERNHQRQILRKLVRPIVRFALRHSLLVPDFIQVLKTVYLEIAREEIKKATDKLNASRLSLMTGINRKEIKGLTLPEPEDESEPIGILERVLGQWEYDKRFRTRQGEPRILTCDGEGSEFFELVSVVSKDFNPATVLFEIQRNGAAELTPRGLKLARKLTLFGQEGLKAYDMLAKDFDTLGVVVDENLNANLPLGHLHLRTEYDNIYQKHLPKIREWLVEEGKILHKRAREYLSALDKDISPEVNESGPAGLKVVVGSFGFSALPAENSQKKTPSKTDTNSPQS
jgi:hypothetical protein